MLHAKKKCANILNMKAIIKKNLEKSKPIQLENYCATKHNFFDIFPADEHDFNDTDYTKYFYFDKEEAHLFLNDFLKFVVENYHINMFRADSYFSVIDEFEKYLEKHGVYYYNRTMVGISMSAKNNVALFKIFKALNPSIMANEVKNPTIFAFGEVDTSRDYNLDFFKNLQQKLDGYTYSKKFSIEPLLKQEVEQILGVFKGRKFVGELPFFLNPSYKNARVARARVITDLEDENLVKSWVVSTLNNRKVVALINLVRCDKKFRLNIICDCEYYDIDFKYVLEFVSKYAIDVLGAKKISCYNDNTELAYSLINSGLTLAGYKPDYIMEAGEGGYSKIEYNLSAENYADKQLEPNTNIIFFVF